MNNKENNGKPILNDVHARSFSDPDIIESLEAAVRLAQGDTGGARVMARALLAAYNG